MRIKDQHIPEEEISEQWFAEKHKVLAMLNAVYNAGGIKLGDIADNIGFTPKSVMNMLSGERSISMRTFHKLAHGMGYRLTFEIEKIPLEGK